MRFKKGVRLRGLHTEMLMGHNVVESVYVEAGFECVITSANDSKHGRGSLHFSGAALDYRLKHIAAPASRARVAAKVKRQLGADFDVLHEAVGRVNEHLHVEYQPKVT